MTLDDIIEKYELFKYGFPPIRMAYILEKDNEKILWIDPDAYSKNGFFIIINEKREVIKELSFKEFYDNLEILLENGWENNKEYCFIKDIKKWLIDFSEKYNIII